MRKLKTVLKNRLRLIKRVHHQISKKNQLLNQKKRSFKILKWGKILKQETNQMKKTNLI